MFRKLIATAALAAGAIVVAPGTANAISRPVKYQLTAQEQAHACGSFVGTIIFEDSSSIDCSTGIATYSLAF